MDRALAATHHQDNVEQPIVMIEDDVVRFVEGIGADGVGPEAGIDIVPVGPPAGDRCGRAAQTRNGAKPAFLMTWAYTDRPEMTAQRRGLHDCRQ